MPSDEFKFQAVGRGLGAMLWSNPANPTGMPVLIQLKLICLQVNAPHTIFAAIGMSLEGEELKAYIKIARELNLGLIADEFYSHYYYDGDAVDPENGGADDDSNWPKTVSSAA
jgi:aspartate/methionine/tyrosine aminotransferase